MSELLHGLYINLDRRRDRRAHMEGELSRFDLSRKYRRLRAYSGPNAAAGCYRSHLRALEEARRIDGIVHIVEDDSIFSAGFQEFVENSAEALLTTYDMLFLDMWIDQRPDSIAVYQAALEAGRPVIPLKKGGPRIGATSSYLVAPRRVGRLHHLLKQRASAGRPIDVTYDKLVKEGEIAAAVVVPFLTGVDLKFGTRSDIQSIPPRDQRMFVMLRTRFFADRARQPSL